MPTWRRSIVSFLLFASIDVAANSAQAAQPIEKADRILVFKSKRELALLRGDAVLKTYPIALGRHPKGPKHRQGDGKTPEGVYFIDGRLTRTPYHLALHISYPNQIDLARAQSAGRRAGGPGRLTHVNARTALHGRGHAKIEATNARFIAF